MQLSCQRAALDASTSYPSARRIFAYRFVASGDGTLRIGVSNNVDNVVIGGTVTLTATPTEFTGVFPAQNATVGSAALSFRR
jgi:hypothetical protein